MTILEQAHVLNALMHLSHAYMFDTRERVCYQNFNNNWFDRGIFYKMAPRSYMFVSCPFPSILSAILTPKLAANVTLSNK